MKKKIVSVLLAGCMTITLLAGCGNGNKDAGGQEKPAEAGSEKVTLDFWVFGGLSEEPVVFQDLAEEFNASQDKIEVVVTAQDWGSRQEKIVTAYQAGDETAPDLYALGPCIEDYGIKMGIISPIEDVLPGIAEQVKELMIPEVAEGVASKDGKMWTIPSWVDLSPYMMYSIEALEAIGLDENSVPKTWSEFKDAAEKFAAAGYTGYSVPMSMDNYSDVNNEFNYWNWQLGGAPMNDEATQMTMNDEHAVTTVEFLKSMYDAGTFSKSAANETYMDRHEQFFGGKCATNIGYTYINGILTDMEVPEDFEYIMAAMPVPDEDMEVDEENAFYRMVSSNMEISVSSLSEKVDAIEEFLQFLIDQNFWHKWVTQVGARTPVDIASYEDETLRAETEKVQPDLVRMYDEGTLMEGVKPKPAYGGVVEVQTTMAEYLVDVIQGKYPSVEEGLNELNNACQELLDEYSNE
ncbi:ABC transporter substrate-binding protein [Mediterraneibacter agrestimuris]|uniref:ABC transporter substrate-binding protein n=1 Tax=Mediterraneibacter agrestimuris TaxID=2941333 RepID=UPI00203FECDE|nr:extracellular solute-binding protein [Mediterraneibacter agrestimuris]